MKVLQPPSWARPSGFSNGIAVRGGTTVYIAGQVGWTGSGVWQAKDFSGQFRQALKNVIDILAQAGGRIGPFGTWPGTAASGTRADRSSSYRCSSWLTRCQR